MVVMAMSSLLKAIPLTATSAWARTVELFLTQSWQGSDKGQEVS